MKNKQLELSNKLKNLSAIIENINIYVFNLNEISNNKDLIIRNNSEDFFNSIFLSFAKLSTIELTKILRDCGNEKSNIFKLIRRLRMSPYKLEINIEKLESKKDIIDEIISYRDSKYAHYDFNSNSGGLIIEDLLNILNEINEIYYNIIVEYKKNNETNLSMTNPKDIKGEIMKTFNFSKYYYH